MSFSAYKHYKDSGIEWIGEIPSNWETHRIKDFLSFKIGGTPSTSIESYFEGDNIWVSIADLSSNIGDYIFDSSVKISDEAIKVSNVKKISKDSLLYSFKLSVGLTAFAGCELYTNEAIASFEPNNFVDLNFLKYVFQVGFENNATENIYGAKLFNTDLIKFARFVMPVDKEEQIKIATFLDNKTLKINENITKNKELISLLEEKKAVLINQVVTKGLNLNGTMKESGIDWIGEIPEHWKIKSLKRIANLQTGTTPKKNKGISKDNGINWFTPGDFNKSFKLISSDKFIHEKIVMENNIRVFPPNSILLVCIGATIGKIGFTTGISYSNQQITAILPKKDIYYKYLLYFLISITDYIKNTANYTTLPIINNQYLSELKIIIPSMDEQKEIACYLDKETSQIDQIISKIQENIDLLEEYKTSLIHYVVTGKIDVRDEI